MSDLSEVVDSLENRISNMLQNYKNLNHIKLELEGELAVLKLANSMLGSNEFKRDTKLKINTLVREIDKCIIQLSE